jgi:transporter family protein
MATSPSAGASDFPHELAPLVAALRVFAGLTAILAKVGVTGVDSNLATAIRTTVILLFAWAIAFATAKPAEMAAFPGRT